MRQAALSNLSVEELVDRFVSLALDQDEAMLDDDIAAVNRLFWKIEAVETELKARPGDQRTALLRLYGHPNMQVRLKAAKATLAVAPEAARALLRGIESSGEQPQAMDAGMCLWTLDEGIFKPE
jgi:cytochrome c oxidase assembly protein Cox11